MGWQGCAAPASHGFLNYRVMSVAECPLTGPASSQSLVLVSRLPFVRLFQSLLSLIAPEYFEKLAPCLEAGEWSSDVAKVDSSQPCGRVPDIGHLCPQFVMRLTNGQPRCLGRP